MISRGTIGRSALHATHREPQTDHLHRMLDLLRYLKKRADTLHDTKLTTNQRGKMENKISAITGASLSKEQTASARRALIAAARAPSFEGRYNAVKRIYLSTIKTRGKVWKEVQKELNLWQPIAGRLKTIKAFRAFDAEAHLERGITLSTIHSAKGKEWDHVIVIVIDGTEGVMPHVKEIRRSAVEEERRLFYVAITRARTPVPAPGSRAAGLRKI